MLGSCSPNRVGIAIKLGADDALPVQTIGCMQDSWV